MAEQTKDERAIWAIFMNVPGPEALTLFDQITKILVARNLVKPKHPRAKKEKPNV